MDERNDRYEEESMTGTSRDELKQEPLIELLFGHRYKGATWLADVQWHLSNDALRQWVAYRVKFFSGSIQGVCFDVYRDFCFLVYNLQVLKLLAEKVLWDALPRRGLPEERELLLSKYNIESNCQLIIGYAAKHVETALADDARDGWMRLGPLAEHILDIRKDSRKALRSLVEADGLLEEVSAWPSSVMRCSQWLDTLKGKSPLQAVSLEDLEQLIEKSRIQTEGVILREGESTRATICKEEALTRDKVEIETKKLEGRKRGLAGPDAWVECFKRFDVASKDDPGSQIEVMRDVMREMKEEGIELGNVRPHKAVEYWREWAKDLKRPQTGEAYDKAKAANKVKKRKARCAK